MAKTSDSDRSPSTDEKNKYSHGKVAAERVDSLGDNVWTSMSPEEKIAAEKKLVRKLDLRIIPWLTLCYLIAFLDRTNIGNATLYDLQEDLHMTSSQYYVALTLFFIPYSIFEPLTNVLLKLFKPHIFITAIIVSWGICMTLMGTVHNFSGLAAVRWFLGLTEAGLFPGINYYLSCWYRRKEFGLRAAVFFSAAALAGSFGGLLAAAIANMNGIGGKAGWSWIFILEGLASIIVGALSWWLVVDFPDDAKFLSPTEKSIAIARLADDQQAIAKGEKFSMKYAWAAYRDWKTYAYAIIYMGCDGPLYAFSLFTPTIIKELGYESTTANLLSVPPYAAAAILTVTIGFIADRTQQRGLCNIGCSLLGMTGFIMLLAAEAPGVKYAGVFLGALGIYPCIANTIAWCGNNVEGVFKRGVVMGTVIGWGNLNGVVSSNIYRKNQAPHYYVGHAVVLGYLSLFLFAGSVLTRIGLQIENSRRKAGKRDTLHEGKSEDEIMVLGDKRPDFLYTL